MSGTFLWITIFAFLAALTNTAGILTVFRYREQAEKIMIYLMCFAAGILITTPLILALPTAIDRNSHAGFMALAGFLFMFFSNKIIRHYTHGEALAFGITAAQGIGIHSFVDGVVYTVTFKAGILLGFLSAGGLVVHEFAEGVITYLVLIRGQVDRKVAMSYAFIIASMSTPLGAFVAYPFVSSLGGSTLGLLLGFVSGVLIYISASHLLPEAQAHEKRHSLVAFLSGVLLASLIVFAETH